MFLQKKRTCAVLIISVVMAILRSVLIAFNMEKNVYDNDTYYLPNNFAVKTFNAFAIIIVLVCITLAFSLWFAKLTNIKHDLKASPVGLMIVAFTLIFFGIVMVRKMLLGEVYTKLEIYTAFLGFACGFVFLILGLISIKKLPSDSTLSLIGLIPTAFTGLRLVQSFLSSNAAPFASSGEYRILGLAALLIFFLYDGKSYISPKTAVIYYLFAYLSVFFLLTYSVPNIVLHCFGTFAFDEHAAYSVVDLGIVSYICSRMFQAKLSTDINE